MYYYAPFVGIRYKKTLQDTVPYVSNQNLKMKFLIHTDLSWCRISSISHDYFCKLRSRGGHTSLLQKGINKNFILYIISDAKAFWLEVKGTSVNPTKNSIFLRHRLSSLTRLNKHSNHVTSVITPIIALSILTLYLMMS